jgi:hypothetical protein
MSEQSSFRSPDRCNSKVVRSLNKERQLLFTVCQQKSFEQNSHDVSFQDVNHVFGLGTFATILNGSKWRLFHWFSKKCGVFIVI